MTDIIERLQHYAKPDVTELKEALNDAIAEIQNRDDYYRMEYGDLVDTLKWRNDQLEWQCWAYAVALSCLREQNDAFQQQ